MAKRTAPAHRTRASNRGDRTRECTYLHLAEAETLQAAADAEWTSKAEILRRALRLYLEEVGHLER